MAKRKIESPSTISIGTKNSNSVNKARIVRDAIQRSIETKKLLEEKCLDDILKASEIIRSAMSSGHKVVLLGNGGSAADAQHIAAELVGRFKAARPPLKSIALTTNSSILTAIGNDFGFDQVFTRQIQSNAEEGDVVIGISTSGKSPNVINAIQEAKRIGAKTIGLTGSGGSQLAQVCDSCIMVPSADTQRIQESHIMIGHVLCELVEADLFPSEK